MSIDYKESSLNDASPVVISKQKMTLREVLDAIAKTQGISYKIIDRHIIIGKRNDITGKKNTTKKRISGKVTDKNGEPLIGASVKVVGSNGVGTITDANGNYAIEVDADAQLEVSYIGYNAKNVKASQARQIILTEDVGMLDELVVVGYGVQRKSDLTGAVVSINAKDLEERPAPNIIQSLQGTVPGLNISITGTNAEGSSSVTRIRGTKSITADSKPLIILDGVPFDGAWSELNPDDIQSIEILKDASSAAIYGARGANGVILITSKRGQTGKLLVSFNAYATIDHPINFPDLMNGEEFYKYKEEALRLANTTTPTEDNPEPWMGSFTTTELAMHAAGEESDWLKLVTQDGLKQNYNLSLRGGTDKTRFFTSFNYTDNKGVAKGNRFERFNVRINLDQEFYSWLKFTTSTQFGRYNRGGSSATFWRAFRMVPLSQAYNEDGSIRTSAWEDSSEAFAVNPLSEMNNRTKDVRVKLITNNALTITFPFVKGLSFKFNTGYTYANSSWKQYQGMDTYYGARSNGILNTDDWHTEEWLIENILAYERVFGKHRIFFTGMYSAQSKVYEQNTMEGKGFPNDVMYYYQMSKAATSSGSSSYSKENHISQMARLNYTYDDRYLATFTVRRDGYSAFGADSKFGVFPSMALGWNIMNEKFFKGKPISKTINNLKYRMSWGKNGNEAISTYSTLPSLSTFNYLDDSHQAVYGFYPSKLASPNLGWETTTSFNVGLDVALWNNRIQSSIDLYWNKTTDLLLYRSIPTINGVGSTLGNIGETKGSGIEWQITSNNISTKDLTWSTTFNISHDRNEIVNVGLFDENGKPLDDVASNWFIGEPISVNYDYNFIGIWQITDANNPEGQQDPNEPYSIPGYMKYKDNDGDGKITTADRQIIGSAVSSVRMNLGNNISYKNFYLSIFLTSQLGRTASNALYDVSTNSYRQNRLMVNFWTPENPTNDYPKNSLDTSVNPHGANFYEKTDYLRISDVTIGYRFPKTILRHTFLQSLELYANGKNLATWTSWTGMDPEYIDNQYAAPPVRSLTFGIKIDF